MERSLPSSDYHVALHTAIHAITVYIFFIPSLHVGATHHYRRLEFFAAQLQAGVEELNVNYNCERNKSKAADSSTQHVFVLG